MLIQRKNYIKQLINFIQKFKINHTYLAIFLLIFFVILIIGLYQYWVDMRIIIWLSVVYLFIFHFYLLVILQS